MLGIQVNKRADPPVFQELVSPVIIIGRIQADVMDGYIRCMSPEFMDGSKKIYRIMTPCICEAEKQRQISMVAGIMKGKRIQGIAKKVVIQVRIPSPVRVRIRIMPETLAAAVRAAILKPAVFESFTKGAGMGMDTGAVTGDCQVAGWDEAKLHGWADSSNE